MTVAQPLRSGQEFSFTAPMRAYSYREGYPYGAYDGALHPDKPDLQVAGVFKRVISPDERLIADDQMFMDIFGHWSLTAGVPGIGSLLFCQLLGEEHQHHIDRHALKQYSQRDGVEVKDVRWPDPTPESLVVHVRVLSRYGTDGSIENYRYRRFSPIYWKKCEQLRQLPIEQGLIRAIEMLRGYQYIPDPAAALRERGFSI